MDEQEREILTALDAGFRSEELLAMIDAKVSAAEKTLIGEPAALLAWEPLDLRWFGRTVPSVIRSSWVFLLRAGAVTGAERHPNSHQRMMSYRGTGDLQIWRDARWHSNPMVSDPGARFNQRWISIPPNTWHQAVVRAGREHWAVVSFHTASTEELIEERPDAEDSSLTHQRKYVGG